MEQKQQTALNEVIHETRRLFQALGSEVNELHQDLGISSSRRAVLECLEKMGEQTVPRIAQDLSVSRQHVQRVVNELLELGLIEARSNPLHKRSQLLAMTALGRRIFKTMEQREAAIFKKASGEFSHHDLDNTVKTLKAIYAYFDQQQWKGLSNPGS
ncbi:MAG: MarR family winged helix-turn-helix transcriptional regulator [Gammaproteobacteria bacterium]|nr:MarR family winged helix-turn-helix transcriptional regulator [Gammaproteobacteria bacterium]